MSARLGDRHFRSISASAEHAIAREVDTRGSHCPGPRSEATGPIRPGAIGDTVAVVTREASTATDIPARVARTGYPLAVPEDLGYGRRHLIVGTR